jgi:hypothetical protein
LNERPTSFTPLAISAEASVSPAKARIRLPSNVKRQRLRAVDQPALARRCGALMTSLRPHAASFTSLISCVRVLRVTTSHERQPPP